MPSKTQIFAASLRDQTSLLKEMSGAMHGLVKSPVSQSLTTIIRHAFNVRPYRETLIYGVGNLLSVDASKHVRPFDTSGFGTNYAGGYLITGQNIEFMLTDNGAPDTASLEALYTDIKQTDGFKALEAEITQEFGGLIAIRPVLTMGRFSDPEDGYKDIKKPVVGIEYVATQGHTLRSIIEGKPKTAPKQADVRVRPRDPAKDLSARPPKKPQIPTTRKEKKKTFFELVTEPIETPKKPAETPLEAFAAAFLREASDQNKIHLQLIAQALQLGLVVRKFTPAEDRRLSLSTSRDGQELRPKIIQAFQKNEALPETSRQPVLTNIAEISEAVEVKKARIHAQHQADSQLLEQARKAAAQLNEESAALISEDHSLAAQVRLVVPQGKYPGDRLMSDREYKNLSLNERTEYMLRLSKWNAASQEERDAAIAFETVLRERLFGSPEGVKRAQELDLIQDPHIQGAIKRLIANPKPH